MSMGNIQKYVFPMILVVFLGWILMPRLLAAEEPLNNKLFYIGFIVTLFLLTVVMITFLEALDQKIWQRKIQG